MPTPPPTEEIDGPLPAWPPAPPAPGTPLAAAFEEVLGVSVAGAAVASTTETSPAAPPDAWSEPATQPVLGGTAGSGAATLAPPPPEPTTTPSAEPARRSSRPSGAWPDTLPARRCPAGHANPPTAAACRSCGAEIVDRSVVVVDRPPLATLVLGDGRTIPVDRPVLLGRNPAAEVIDGLDAALVALDDPDRRLSRTHLEVRAVQWQLIVVDRASTNGSTLTDERGTTVRLVPDVPASAAVGTVLELGGVARIEVRADD